MNVKILSFVEECLFTSISFASNSITKSYTLGDESLSVKIPNFLLAPDCGYQPVVESRIVAPHVLPEGINLSDYIAVDFVTGTIQVLKTMNLFLKDKSI